MKIGNKSIESIYKYKEGVTFELNDIIYYNGMLYTVIAGTYNDNLTPDESPRCESFIEKLANSKSLVTANNLLPIINNIVDGLQLGGTISRITINDKSNLNRYTKNGVYSMRCSLFSEHAFESILRVYRFEIDSSKKVLQEIINYSDLRSLGQDTWPTTIWVRVGTLNEYENVEWGEFTSIVSAYNNADYGRALADLFSANNKVMDTLSNISSKLNNASHYFINKDNDNKYHLNQDRSGVVNIIFTYLNDGINFQDNLTYDLSQGTGRVISTSGRSILINITTSETDWIINSIKDFTDNNNVIDVNVLKVIELHV